MTMRHPHPMNPASGHWLITRTRAIWRRDRLDPTPLTSFDIQRPPRQTEIVYSEERLREGFCRTDISPSARPPERSTTD
jgi:hypothetical protein